jgi:hypothetical protein
MTQEQMAQIRKARLGGQGYRATARMVGLSRDVVRNYCKAHGLDGYADSIMPEPTGPDQCLCCGGALNQGRIGRKRKFCCDACRRKWWAVHQECIDRRAYYTMQCACCGKEFESYGNSHRKYCSHQCYIRKRFKETAECLDKNK